MSDVEMTKLCAEAMGWTFFRSKHGYWSLTDPDGGSHHCCDWAKFDPSTGEKLAEPTEADALLEAGFDPLTDDAQAMQLVKRFDLHIDQRPHPKRQITVQDAHFTLLIERMDNDLNRAIVTCVASLQREGK